MNRLHGSASRISTYRPLLLVLQAAVVFVKNKQFISHAPDPDRDDGDLFFPFTKDKKVSSVVLFLTGRTAVLS